MEFWMKYQGKYFGALLASLMLFTTCKSDFFEQVVDIEIPEHNPLLTVSSYLVSGDSVVSVYVSYSLGILDTAKRVNLKNAKVLLLKNTVPLAQIPYSTKQFYSIKLPKTKPIDKGEYELYVSAPGYQQVSSKQIMPEAAPILNSKFEKKAAINRDGEKVDLLTIDFEDLPGVKNYYAVQAQLQISPTEKFPLQLDAIDPISEKLDRHVLLKDDSFDGKKYSWRLGSRIEAPKGAKLIIQLQTITKDKYLFLKSIHLNEAADDNPFAEPVLIHSNIYNGFGIFSAEARSYRTIDL